MDTIKSYVESVFVQLPRTPEMYQLKEDMLTNMEDKYLQLKSEGQSENEAIELSSPNLAISMKLLKSTI